MIVKMHCVCTKLILELLGLVFEKLLLRSKSDGKINEFYFCCSNEGFVDIERQKKDKNDYIPEVPTEKARTSKKRKTRYVNEIRTGCKAIIRFKRKESGKYYVIQHNVEHNHDLVNPSERHHLKYERSIKEEMGKLIEKMIESRIKPMDCYTFLTNEAGTEEVIRQREIS